MNRRPGFIIVIIVFIVALGGFYIYLKKQQDPGIQPINAVPLNSALIIEIKEPTEFFKNTFLKNNFFKSLGRLDAVGKFQNKILMFDSTLTENEKLKNFFTNHPLLISIHDIGKNEFYSLFVVRVNSRFESNTIFKAIESSWGSKFTISSERYNQVKLYKISDGKESFYYGYHNGLLIGSASELLIEDAIRQAESPHGLHNQNDLKRLMETSGDHAEANIYLQFQYFESFLSQIVSFEYLKENSFNKIGEWVELDLNIKSQTLLLNGFAFSSEEKDRLLNLFQGQSPQTIKFPKFVSVGAEGFMGFCLSNLSLFKQNLRTYMQQTGQIDRYALNQKIISDAFGINAEKNLETIFAGEAVQVTMPGDLSLFYIKTQGYRDGSELIQTWLNYYSKQNGFNISDFKTEYKIDNETMFPIYKLPIDYLPTRLFGPHFKSCKANYVAVFDDYIVFSDTYKQLATTIYNNVLQKTLAYDGAYTQFSDYLSSKVNFFGYVSLIGTGDNLKKLLTSNSFAYFKNNQELLRDFYAIGWQFAKENNLYYNNLLFRFQPSNTLKAATEWETRLDTVIAFKPELMVNHYTKEKEILVQDEKNNVYLINHSGRVLWKKNIEAPIMGEVYQVDYYKNGKLQYLFNTVNKLHMLDRNGNFVEHYPIALPDKVAAPLAVFEYENRKNYRLVLPFENRKVLVYDIEGKKITGFKFSGTDTKIIARIQYVRNDSKDFVIVTDESRVYLLDRRGNVRANPKIQFEPSKNNVFAYQPGNKITPGRLVRTDNKGTIYFIYFDGNVEEKKIGDFTENHFFSLEDVTGDKINDYVYVDKNTLSVYNLSGKKVFSHKFSSTIKHAPSFYRFSSNKTYVGITEVDAGKIYLINEEGEIVNGFPLPGKTRFSIGFLEPGSGRFNLVVGGNEYYLYNFKLN